MKPYFIGLAVCLIIITFQQLVFSQSEDHRSLSRLANVDFEKKDYESSRESYQKLLGVQPDNSFFNYRLGVCYFNSASERKKAISCLEKSAESLGAKLDSESEKYNTEIDSIPGDVFYYLAKSYHHNNQFEKINSLV